MFSESTSSIPEASPTEQVPLPKKRKLMSIGSSYSCDLTVQSNTPDIIVKLYSNFSERCLRMLEEEKYTDVTFLVEDQLFKAHRAILASRSDYFDRLLFGSMKEASSSEVRLEDTPANAFKHLLRFMYCSSVETLELETAIDLLGLAERYVFDELKAALEWTLCCIVDLNTVLPLLSCADTYNALKLYRKCALFVNNNSHDLLQSEVILSLSLPHFISLLSLDQLSHEEAEVSHTVQRWIDCNNPTEGDRSMLNEYMKSRFQREEVVEATTFSSLVAIRPLEEIEYPVNIIRGIQGPKGLSPNSEGELIVAWHHDCDCERDMRFRRDCARGHVSIFSFSGEQLFSVYDGEYDIGCRLVKPQGITIDSDDRILVTDTYNIHLFSSDGEYIGSGLEESVEGADFNPVNKKLYVVEWKQCLSLSVLPKMERVFSTSTALFEFDRYCTPIDVACDRDGTVFVICHMHVFMSQTIASHYCVRVYTAEGQYLREFGKDGDGNKEFEDPSSIFIKAGRVYVCDRGNHRVSIFSTDGQFLRSFGSEGSAPGQFNSPSGVAVDDYGFIYVSDCGNNRIQVF